jgi:hypothetical protein
MRRNLRTEEKKMERAILSLSIACMILLIVTPVAAFPSGQAEAATAELPVLITSCGQSPGATMLKVIFSKMGFSPEPKAYEVNMLATADDLRAAESTGHPYRSLIIVMGASLKGMGAAGISIDDELSRTARLIEEAKSLGLTVIGAHIEGMKRRAQGAAAGDNTDELSIDAIAPNSNLLLVNKDGNTDNRFSLIAKEKNIPLILVEKNLDILEELKKIFPSR